MRHIFLLTQDTDNGYDIYDSLIVIAETPKEAIQYSIDRFSFISGEVRKSYHWTTDPNNIKCKAIGVPLATEEDGLVLSSFKTK